MSGITPRVKFEPRLIMPGELQHDADLCQSCQVNERRLYHTCPLAVDYEECNCCDECTLACGYDR